MTDREGHPRFDVRVTATDHFAWLRTRLAVERTIMAWLRTAVSLIGFGFAIAARLRRGGPILGTAIQSHGCVRVTATSDHDRRRVSKVRPAPKSCVSISAGAGQ